MKSIFTSLLLWHLFAGCNDPDTPSTKAMESAATNTEIIDGNRSVTVERVTTSGKENNYNFSVTLSSPDTGCSQYADWWEVISEDGNTLIYRRILAHSHVSEQPFTRSGGTVPIKSSTVVIIRGHMNNLGYGINVLKGSIDKGFIPTTLDESFALDISKTEPLPKSCAF